MKEEGFFSASVAVMASAIAILLIAALGASNTLPRKVLRFGEELQARYAAEAVLVAAVDEVRRSGLPASAWDQAQRREAWGGQNAYVKFYAAPFGADTPDQCTELLGDMDYPGNVLLALAGVSSRGGEPLEIAEFIVIHGVGKVERLRRRLLFGTGPRSCIL